VSYPLVRYLLLGGDGLARRILLYVANMVFPVRRTETCKVFFFFFLGFKNKVLKNLYSTLLRYIFLVHFMMNATGGALYPDGCLQLAPLSGQDPEQRPPVYRLDAGTTTPKSYNGRPFAIGEACRI
jgi:hypothetical protein